MDFSGLASLKSTIIGVLIILGATYAMLKEICTFDQWWQIILVVIALVTGGGLMMAKKKDDAS